MSLAHPSLVSLKHEQCPDCRKKLDPPALAAADGTVRARCRNEACGWGVELFFLGEDLPALN